MYDIKFFESVIYKFMPNRLREAKIKKNFTDFYEFILLNFNGNNFLEKLYHYYKNDDGICCCGNKKGFKSFREGYRSFCSVSCSMNNEKTREKYIKTCNSKYGVDNISKLDSIKKKKEKTFLSKYGVKTILNTDKVKNIIKEKYGVTNAFQSEEIKNKIKNSNIKKYGVPHNSQRKDIKEKRKETCLSKYGFTHFSKTDKFNKIMSKYNFNNSYNLVNDITGYKLISMHNDTYNILHEVCNNEFEIKSQLFRKRRKEGCEICLKCNPFAISYSENLIYELIKGFELDVIKNYRDVLEIDILLPNLNIGIEYNGLYWHSELYKDNNYHMNKTKYFKQKGIRIIHIWEDDWKFKNDIIISMLKENLNIMTNVIDVKCCQIVEISKTNANLFLNKNHINGRTYGNYYNIALEYENEIFSVLSISKIKNGYCNILSLSNKINYKIDSLSILLKYFIDKYRPIKIDKKIDNSYESSDIYECLGFVKIKDINPNFTYLIKSLRENRFNYSKNKLIKMGFNCDNKTEHEFMLDNDYYKIYDCGYTIFELII